MPRVATVNGASVQQKAAPNVYQQANAPAAAFGAAQAQALQGAGDAMGQTGNVLFKRGMEMKEEEDAAATMNAYSKASESMRAKLYDPEAGLYSKRGAASFNAIDEAQGAFKTTYEETISSLTSPAQRTAFDKLWTRRRDSEMESVSRHVLGERQKYIDESAGALVQTAVDDAVANRNTPEAVATSLGIARTAVLANAKGQSPDVIELKLKTAESAVHKGIIAALVDEDPIKAEAYYKGNKGQIRAEDQDGIERLLKPAVLKRTAQDEATKIISSGREIGPNGDALEIALETQESGGRQFGKDGKPLTSPKGAIGVWQVMPDTARETADKHGIPWDETKYKTDRAYNKSLGKAYLSDQMKEFGGNQVLALAAYNAGPAQVQKWIKDFGDPRTGTISSAEWAEKIPFPETAEYVAKITATAARLSGKVPGAGREDEDAAYSTWLAQADGIKDPDLREQVQRNLGTEYSRRQRARVGDERAATQEGYAEIQAGRELSPALMARIPPSTLASLQSYQDRRERGEKTKTDFAVYNDLSKLAGTDPEAFATTDLLDPKYLGGLSDDDRRRFSDLQRSYLTAGEKGEASRSGQRTNTQIVAAAVEQLFPTTKARDANAARIGDLQARVDVEIEAYKVEHKKPPGAVEVQKIVDGLIVKGNVAGSGWLGSNVGRDSKYVFEMSAADRERFVVADTPKDIPEADRGEFVAALERHLGKKPSDAEVVSAYNKWVQSNNIR
jgi:soluble lytic murein transglycosylase